MIALNVIDILLFTGKATGLYRTWIRLQLKIQNWKFIRMAEGSFATGGKLL